MVAVLICKRGPVHCEPQDVRHASVAIWLITLQSLLNGWPLTTPLQCDTWHAALPSLCMQMGRVTELPPCPGEQSAGSGGGSNTGAIVGGVVGGVAALAFEY